MSDSSFDEIEGNYFDLDDILAEQQVGFFIFFL